ncbi:MAG: hypothetical protein NWR87_03415 [Rhodospirillales bacterium]|nr:hypothetical protein [Rhodospirillales bacterium]
MRGDAPESILIQNDRDSLHVLPLEILPLQTPGLKRARMIKNAGLTSVIELFQDASAGSGQLDVRDLPNEFDWADANNHPDMIILRKAAALPSYDVFSLRVALRQLGISISENEALKLSPDMNKELTTYMTDFTRPLIMQIYGKDDSVKIETFEDVVGLFRDPDVKMALEKLKMMAEKLGIKPDEVPAFIEDYGDIFLSLSYYRKCLDSISPIITDFLDSLPELRTNYSLKHDQSLQKTVNMMENKIGKLTGQIRKRFDSFEAGTKDMWDDITEEKFRKLQGTIKSHHVTLGGTLCSLSVKMDSWHQLFPKRSVGSPHKRAEFIMTHMRQGMDKIKNPDESKPTVLTP